MKRIIILSIAVILLLLIAVFIYNNRNTSQCQIGKMIFYYSDGCAFCQKVKEDGTIEKLKELGVKIEEIDVNKGTIRHNIEGIPSFIIENKVYAGYKTIEELKALLNCKL